jgi:flagellar FliJ protein
MTRSPPWNRLKEVAGRRCDEQARRLADAKLARDEAQRRLDMLVGYRGEYEARLARAGSQGIDREALRNYQAFLAQLERAIAQQADLVAGAERSVQGARAQWQSERTRVESFEVLGERHGVAVARDEARRSQKDTDEWAARAAIASRDQDH